MELLFQSMNSFIKCIFRIFFTEIFADDETAILENEEQLLNAQHPSRMKFLQAICIQFKFNK